MFHSGHLSLLWIGCIWWSGSGPQKCRLLYISPIYKTVCFAATNKGTLLQCEWAFKHLVSILPQVTLCILPQWPSIDWARVKAKDIWITTTKVRGVQLLCIDRKNMNINNKSTNLHLLHICLVFEIGFSSRWKAFYIYENPVIEAFMSCQLKLLKAIKVASFKGSLVVCEPPFYLHPPPQVIKFPPSGSSMQ